MDPVIDLQAQVIALRAAVEGAWLAMLRRDGDAHAQAERIGRESVDAIGELDAKSADALAMRAAIIRHTEQLWGSIGWQLGQDEKSA
jgi:hypothetical protein